jgi:hypothetical protein
MVYQYCTTSCIAPCSESRLFARLHLADRDAPQLAFVIPWTGLVTLSLPVTGSDQKGVVPTHRDLSRWSSVRVQAI